jgi:CxxC motif-containing protein (DUF1111 family)
MTIEDRGQPRRALRRGIGIERTAILAGLALASIANAQTPDYEGSVCVVGPDQVRFTLETDVEATNVLLYPDPPGGGWYMDRVEPGRFVREMTIQEAAEQSIRFSLIIQTPAQYAYPDHVVQTGSGCVEFERDDVMPPPPRGFEHALTHEDGTLRFEFEAFPGNGVIPATGEVALRYRIDGGELLTTIMASEEPHRFTTELPGVREGASVEYWFAQRIGVQRVDSTLFTRTAGTPDETETAFPLTAKTAGRFRDRHPNEWRFDHYVENYAGGKIFEIVLTDHGDSLDVEVVADEVGGPERVDFKYYIQNDPGEMCDRPLTAVNLVMERDPDHPHRFHQRIPDITPGQIIEFDFTHIGVPNPEGGTFQYYTEYFYYHSGTGRFGTGRSNPRANAAGAASIDTVSAPRFGFAQHATNLTAEELGRFMDGKVRFETDHRDGLIKNFPTRFDCCSGPIGYVLDPSPHARAEALGPRFNEASCIACHMMDGRGATPTGTETTLSALVLQLSLGGAEEDGAPIPHPLYGRQFDTDARPDAEAEGRLTVDYEVVEGAFADGTPYQLRRPTYVLRDTAFGSPGSNLPDADGSEGYEGTVQASPRIAPMLAGVGLLEAVDEAVILALADPQDLNGDGISGRANWVRDLVDGDVALGRFGWKAGQPGLLQQTAVAYQRDLGLTSPWTPTHDCGDEDPDCPGEAPGELSASDVSLVADYVAGLTLPPRRNHEDPEAIIGMQLFREANCQACHVPELRTRADHEVAAYRDQLIQPFTDLLLHDMGPELADGFDEFGASGSEWRTPPLWGAEYVGHVLGVPETCTDPFSAELTPNYLHDGRARSLMEAILWHGGEAAAARDAVLAMNADERSALLAFVAYPFADPSLAPPVTTSCPEDLDGDGRVDGSDLVLLLGQWGGSGPADLDADGVVDGEDLTRLLGNWNGCG